MTDFSVPTSKSLLRQKKAKKVLIPIVGLVILGLVGFGIYSVVKQNAGVQSSSGQMQSNVQAKTQTIDLNKTFDLPTGLEGGKDNIQPLKITFRNAQLTNRITVGGNAKTAPNGGMYLMLNLLIENTNTQGLGFKSRDIIRLVDPNNKKFAPSLYNQSVTVDADSVKKDTVGFLVPNNQKTFKIQYGSLNGTKQMLDLTFK